MITKNKEKLDIINEINKNIIKNVNEKIAPLVCKFSTRFLSTISVRDLKNHDIKNLYGAILYFWKYIYKKEKLETKIRIYNPSIENNGWESKHTIIEILCENMPFIVDSIMIAINTSGLQSHLIIHSGDIAFVRGKNGEIIDVIDYDKNNMMSGDKCEAPLFIEINRQTDLKVISDLKRKILDTINTLQLAVNDWGNMQEQIKNAIADVKKTNRFLDEEEMTESISFLKWMLSNNFTFLGIKHHNLVKENNLKKLLVDRSKNLGIFKNKSIYESDDLMDEVSKYGKELMLSKSPLIISKTNLVSNVHRASYADYIGIKSYNNKGEVVNIIKIVGLFTSSAYTTELRNIPLLRKKIDRIFLDSNRNPESHAGKNLKNILNHLPRDELFQARNEYLLLLSKGISYIQERKQIRFFGRVDDYGNFISCFVFVPREIFTTEIREKYQDILLEEFNADDIQYSSYLSDSVLARINFIIRIDANAEVEINASKIEKKLVDVSKKWEDNFYASLHDHFGEEHGYAYFNKYKNAFSVSYQDKHDELIAAHDVSIIEKLNDNNVLELKLYRPVDDLSSMLRFKIFSWKKNIPLSDVVPILENMGLKVIFEQPFVVNKKDKVFISEFGLEYCLKGNLDPLDDRKNFQEFFYSVWAGLSENDYFNWLAISCSINWREVSILRMYAKYLHQIRFKYSQQYIEQACISNSSIVKKIVTLFHYKFNPDMNVDEQDTDKLIKGIQVKLDKVVNLDEDIILRRYLSLILATTRTNFYQLDENGQHKTWMSIKLDSRKIPEIPLPKPMYEIFVYSTKFEGIHLRSSLIARGGIRWSKRREDFRTEILGLMKAQNVKNAIIVPDGAKGGFVLKHSQPEVSNELSQKTALVCYQEFISGLLDITDNKIEGRVISPERVITHDMDDYYLVLAADTGTSSFSDAANEISKKYNFWLKDAFASGGSTGYDHKKMGITAKGAWESVKRHFKNLGVNTQEQMFTVIGIGDMSGDVFGNGMLSSRKIKLIAAFNHQHIFIDPNPDVEASYEERKRLFNLSRSSWSDYNVELLSNGGGVYNRKDKKIHLSKEAQVSLGINADDIIPDELIKLILQAPVDLLWNGGIGTYVKSSKEKHYNVGDKNNDNVRIDANQLRCKIIGEGGNLGLTQSARIEFSLAKGHVYTDFVDNSAGVDCSDHEVNIKILLNSIVDNGDLTIKQRNELLKDMTEEVSDLVINNNYQHTLALSMLDYKSKDNLELHRRYIDTLSQNKLIDRRIEYLPNNEDFQLRKQANMGVTTPVIAILTSYTKHILKENILKTDLHKDLFCNDILLNYFPSKIRHLYQQQILKHELSREIIATSISNNMINEVGFTFIYRLMSETGCAPEIITKAYLAAKKIFNYDALRKEIADLDFVVNADIQYELLNQLVRVLRRATRWILKKYRSHLVVADFLTNYQEKAHEAFTLYPKYLMGYDKNRYNKKIARYKSAHLPNNLASFFSMSRALHSTLDCIDICISNNYKLEDVIEIYFKLGAFLNLSWLKSKIIFSEVTNNWDALTRESLRDDLDWQQKNLSFNICSMYSEHQVSDRVTVWAEQHKDFCMRWEEKISEVREQEHIDFNVFFVVIRELLDMTHSARLKIEKVEI